MKLKKSKKPHFFKGGQLFHERFNELNLLDEYPIELREKIITPHKVATEKKKKEKPDIWINLQDARPIT
ncbi:hypothetical protein P7H12_08580 [Paenibacillus larvae]|nr:hypothetical protein [Paenibacillus larvae]MDT2263632.1 hypothetical protein [Paenibacillus larvae]